MKASPAWLTEMESEFSAGVGRAGLAPLTHYSVSYREWGDGPPLILVPGLAGGYELLGPLARLLARQFRVISYQLRGEDDSFLLRRRFTLGDLAEDLAEFIQWHCLESPVVMGVSFGGAIALEYAARYPHRLGQLIVQGAGARFEQGLLHRVAGTVLSRFPLPADNPFINQFFNLLFGSRQKPGPMFEFVTRQCWQTDQSVMAHRLQLVEDFDLGDRLHRLHMPTLILAGDRDLLVSDGNLEALHHGLARSELVRLPGAGHLAFVTQAKRVAAEVERFCAPVGEW